MSTDHNVSRIFHFLLFVLFVPSIIGSIFVLQFVRDEFKGIPYSPYSPVEFGKLKTAYVIYDTLRSHFSDCTLEKRPEYFRTAIVAYLYVLADLRRVVSSLKLKGKDGKDIQVDLKLNVKSSDITSEIMTILNSAVTIPLSRTIFHEYNEAQSSSGGPLFEKIDKTTKELPSNEVYNQLFGVNAKPELKKQFEQYLANEDSMFELYLPVNMNAITQYEAEESKNPNPLLFEKGASSTITIKSLHAQLKSKPELKKKFDEFASTKQFELFLPPSDSGIETKPEYKEFADASSPFRKLINDINVKWVRKTRMSDILNQVYCVFAGTTFKWEYSIVQSIRQWDAGEEFPSVRDAIRCKTEMAVSHKSLLYIALGTQVLNLLLGLYYIAKTRSADNQKSVFPQAMIYVGITVVIIISLSVFLAQEDFKHAQQLYIGNDKVPTGCATLKGKHWESVFAIIIMGMIIQLLLRSALLNA